MAIILGVDPGSRVTGYGVIKTDGNRRVFLTCGCIRIKSTEWGERLKEIFLGLREVIAQYNPVELAIEQVFMHRDANAALKLGQARGAAIVAASMSELSFAEYSPREIKLAVVGYGAAEKEQVQHMVTKLLNLSAKPSADAADALAVALCHANCRESKLKGLLT